MWNSKFVKIDYTCRNIEYIVYILINILNGNKLHNLYEYYTGNFVDF